MSEYALGIVSDSGTMGLGAPVPSTLGALVERSIRASGSRGLARVPDFNAQRNHLTHKNMASASVQHPIAVDAAFSVATETASPLTDIRLPCRASPCSPGQSRSRNKCAHHRDSCHLTPEPPFDMLIMIPRLMKHTGGGFEGEGNSLIRFPIPTPASQSNHLGCTPLESFPQSPHAPMKAQFRNHVSSSSSP